MPDLIKLNSREAAEFIAEHGIDVPTRELDRMDDFVSSYYRLSRGSAFVECEGITTPVTFTHSINGRRCHVLVAREYGDVSWPAWLNQQRIQARGDCVMILRRVLGPVTAWLASVEADDVVVPA